MTLLDIRPGERQITNLMHRRIATTSMGSFSEMGEALIRVTYRADPATKQGTTRNAQHPGFLSHIIRIFFFKFLFFCI